MFILPPRVSSQEKLREHEMHSSREKIKIKKFGPFMCLVLTMEITDETTSLAESRHPVTNTVIVLPRQAMTFTKHVAI